PTAAVPSSVSEAARRQRVQEMSSIALQIFADAAAPSRGRISRPPHDLRMVQSFPWSFIQAYLLRWLDGNGPVQVSERVIHDVSLGAHLLARDDAVRLGYPDPEPGRHIGPKQGEDRCRNAIDG